MATIVGVHGINQQLKGADVLHSEWWLPLKDGVKAAGRDLPDGSLVCAFYGGLFRASGAVRVGGDASFRADDVDDPFEEELLRPSNENHLRRSCCIKDINDPHPNGRHHCATDADFAADPRNCGECGHQCLPGESCSDGHCCGRCMKWFPGNPRRVEDPSWEMALLGMVVSWEVAAGLFEAGRSISDRINRPPGC